MGNNIPRRQHSIPRLLVKRFCDDRGQIWVNNGRKVYLSKPKDVFVKHDQYTKFELDGSSQAQTYEEFVGAITKHYDYEQTLSKIEDKAAPAIAQIIKHARQSRCPQLSPSLRNAWKQFLVATARRTSESQDRVSFHNYFERNFFEVFGNAAKTAGYPLPDNAEWYSDPVISKVKNIVEANTRAGFAAGTHPILQEESGKFCSETSLGIVIIQVPDKSFAIGSHGIALVESNTNGVQSEAAWLPIAHDVAVCATPFAGEEWLLPLSSNNSGAYFVDQMNEASAKNSEIIAGRSEYLVRSLTPRKSTE